MSRAMKRYKYIAISMAHVTHPMAKIPSENNKRRREIPDRSEFNSILGHIKGNSIDFVL